MPRDCPRCTRTGSAYGQNQLLSDSARRNIFFKVPPQGGAREVPEAGSALGAGKGLIRPRMHPAHIKYFLCKTSCSKVGTPLIPKLPLAAQTTVQKLKVENTQVYDVLWHSQLYLSCFFLFVQLFEKKLESGISSNSNLPVEEAPSKLSAIYSPLLQPFIPRCTHCFKCVRTLIMRLSIYNSSIDRQTDRPIP